MRDLVDEALAQAFKEEIAHVFRNMSRDLDTLHGGHRKAAAALIETIRKLRLFHAAIVDLLNASD